MPARKRSIVVLDLRAARLHSLRAAEVIEDAAGDRAVLLDDVARMAAALT